MIDHSGIQVSDIATARAFYDACFKALGAKPLMEVPKEHTGRRWLWSGQTGFLAKRRGGAGADAALCL